VQVKSKPIDHERKPQQVHTLARGTFRVGPTEKHAVFQTTIDALRISTPSVQTLEIGLVRIKS
jgi:hypothetical protein